MVVRVGMLSYAHVHAPMYLRLMQGMRDVEIVGVAEPDRERAAEAEQAFGVRTFERVEDLFAQGLDGMVVESENTRHAADVILAAQLGVPILCEKPMATSRVDAEAMVAACEANDAPLMVAFPMRFSEPLRVLRRAVAAGELGKVVAFEGVNQGQLPKHRRNWFVDPALSGGGAVTDHTVHLADAMRWILDDEFVEVYAQANDIVARGEVEIETSGLLSLRFRSGAVATIDCSWNRPKTFPAWGGLAIRVNGSAGTADVDAYARKVNAYDDFANRFSTVDCSDNAYFSMLRHFVKVMREEAVPTPSGLDGLRAVDVVEAAYASIRTGEPAAL